MVQLLVFFSGDGRWQVVIAGLTPRSSAAGNMKTLHNHFSIPNFMVPDNAF